MGNVIADISVGTFTINLRSLPVFGNAHRCVHAVKLDDVLQPAIARFEPTQPALNRPPFTLRFARSLFCRSSHAALGNEHGNIHIR
jgi:hypothetical protein